MEKPGDVVKIGLLTVTIISVIFVILQLMVMDMFFYLDENDNRPIYQQLAAQVKMMIMRGELKPGDELPSVRDVSENLAINLHTVHSAYRKLREEGIINLRLGRRATVARRRSAPVTGRRSRCHAFTSSGGTDCRSPAYGAYRG